MADETKPVWNSLEVTKLIFSLFVPASIVVFGYVTNDALQNRQHEIRLSEAVITKRKEIYDQIRIPLNNIFTYIEEVGGYKKFTPTTINNDRRKLHQIMHTQRAYWSTETFTTYLKYMDEVAFKTWQGENTDALIHDDPGQKKNLDSWKKEFSNRFSGPQHSEHKLTYDRLLDLIALDIGANVGG